MSNRTSKPKNGVLANEEGSIYGHLIISRLIGFHLCIWNPYVAAQDNIAERRRKLFVHMMASSFSGYMGGIHE